MESQNISNRVFGQDNNNGDHRIRCRAQRGNGGSGDTVRYSDYITVKGNSYYFNADNIHTSSIIISL